MILRAIENGVPEERLARALNVNVGNIRHKRVLLDGICPEAIALLRDKHVPINTFGELKKLKPVRQIEAAESMVTMNRYSRSEEHTSELQSLMRISYAVFFLKKTKKTI